MTAYHYQHPQDAQDVADEIRYTYGGQVRVEGDTLHTDASDQQVAEAEQFLLIARD